jgi:hypothetical protein
VRRGGPLGREEARDEAHRQQAEQQQEGQRAELMPGVLAHGERQLVRREAGHRERPCDQRDRARRGAEEHDGAAQPKRRDREPDDQPHPEREERAARVGEHQHELEQGDARPGERAGDGAARAARAEPDQRRDAERGHESDGVPVVERRAQPGVGLLRRERLGEHAREQRPRRDDHAGEREAVQQRRPAAGGEPRERHRPREGREVREGAARLDPGVRRRQRPRDRGGREGGEQPDAEQRAAAVQALHAGARHEQRRRAQRGAEHHEHDLDPRRALEAQAAVGRERGAGEDERDAEQDRDERPAAAAGGDERRRA